MFPRAYNAPMNDITIDETVDASGLNCPLPLLKAKQSLNRLESGMVLRLICTDPGSVRDFDVFSKQSGHALLESGETDGTYTYLIRKS